MDLTLQDNARACWLAQPPLAAPICRERGQWPAFGSRRQTEDWTLVLVGNLANADEWGMESGVQRGQSRHPPDGHDSAADGFSLGLGVKARAREVVAKRLPQKRAAKVLEMWPGGLLIPGSPERRGWF